MPIMFSIHPISRKYIDLITRSPLHMLDHNHCHLHSFAIKVMLSFNKYAFLR